MTTARFYDDLATYYDLIFQDWESSMSRQGDAITQLIRRELGSEHQPSEISSLDASAGIGTQALPLARKGFRVTARDISPDAIARLQRETAERGLVIPSAVADMRALRSAVSEPFHVVLSFDVRTTMTYYAVSIARLMELMGEAGFVGVTRDDAVLYQPVLIGHRKPD